MQQREDGHVCPVAKVAELLSDRWTMLIIRDLLRGPRRFCDLERSLVGVSTRTLTQKLRLLIAQEVVAHDELRYALTLRGKRLGSVIRAMERYGKQYL